MKLLLAGLALLVCSAVHAQPSARSADPVPGGSFSESMTHFRNIIDFTVHRLSSGRVLVCWHTAAGSRDKGFVLERKNGDEAVFVPVALIPSQAGTGQETLDYTFSDKNNYSGISYYRIKQTDSSGKNYFTTVAKINGKRNE